MTPYQTTLIVSVLCAGLASCHTGSLGSTEVSAPVVVSVTEDEANTVPASYEATGARAMLVANGGAPSLLEQRALDLQSDLPLISAEMREALEVQRALLKRQSPRKTYSLGGQVLTRRDFLQVVDDLLSGRFHAAPLAAKPVADNGAVRFTGYYSPEIRVSRKKTSKYRYPILAYPKHIDGALPSRYDIERNGALEGKAEVLAYASHVMDVYTLQLQGSGFVRFEDGSRRYLAYGGTNRYPYQSIGLALQRRDTSVTDISHRGLRNWVSAEPAVRDSITTFNPNYGFFRLDSGKARGAAGVPLQEMVSVAADPQHYPLGSVLLARVPVTNKPGQFRTQLLLVQDTGGAINGAAHLDLYTGVGEDGLDIAERTGAEGEVYLLLPG